MFASPSPGATRPRRLRRLDTARYWLRSQSTASPRRTYVWSGEEGLIVFHVVRSAIAAQLRSEDPSRYRRLRIAAWNQVRGELLRAPRSQLGRYGTDLLYLSDEPPHPRRVLPEYGALTRSRPRARRRPGRHREDQSTPRAGSGSRARAGMVAGGFGGLRCSPDARQRRHRLLDGVRLPLPSTA
jgi:hypothetical protein